MTGFFLISLQGELRRIKSGRRIVHVDSIGPKRVKLRSPTTLAAATVSRETWNKLAPHAVPHAPDLAKLRTLAAASAALRGRELTKIEKRMLGVRP